MKHKISLSPGLLTACVSAILSGLAAAQVGNVWIVDAAAGPSANFATIDAAVAAASAGDTILVRSGLYPEFTLISKNLAVVADEGATVRVQGGPRVAFTPAGPPNVLHGIDFMPSTTAIPQASIATGNLGADTWMSDCSVRGAWFRVSSSTAIFDHCSLRGMDAAASPLKWASPALDQGISFVAAFGTELRGGIGQDGSDTLAATPGAAALFSKTGTWAARCNFIGGKGGAAAFSAVSGCQDAQSGGPAVAVEIGWFFGSTNQFTGGAGGTAAAGCTSGPGASGPAIELVAGVFSNAVETAVPTPLLTTPGVVREGQPLKFEWNGPAGAALVLVSGAVDFKQSESSPLSAGSMPLLVAAPFSIFLVDVLPTDGSASLTLNVPELGPGVASRRIYAQALHLDPTTWAIHSGGARAIVLLDSAY